MIPPTWIGFAAAAFTTFSLFPQVLRIWRTRQAEAISVPAFIFFAAGVLLWLIYGIMDRDFPLIVANSITFILSSSIVVLSLIFRKQNAGAGKELE